MVKRIEPWLMFYIETASHVDYDDPNWTYYCIHNRDRQNDLVGVVSVYRGYSSLDCCRWRISQALTLPLY